MESDMSSPKKPKGPSGPQTGNRIESSEAAKQPGGAAGEQSTEIEELARLTAEIERAWYDKRDHRAVDRLAAEHPALAQDLYEFFATLTAAVAGYGRSTPKLAENSRRVREWLQREGFAMAAAAAGQTSTSTSATEQPKEGAAKESVEPKQGSTGRKSFFATLKELTGEHKPTVLASALDMAPDFLTLVSDRSDVLRKGAREEIKKRVKAAWDIDPAQIASSLEGGAVQQRAASRSGPYTAPAPTYEDLVNNSSLSPSQKKFWLSLD